MSDTRCVHGVGGLSVDPDGRTKLCCMSAMHLTNSEGRVLNVGDDRIEEAWTSPLRHEIVEALTAGQRHENCKLCWAEEDAGRESKRQRDNKKGFGVRSDQPVVIDLKLGNTCNLKCRTCWIGNSSKWMREEYDTTKHREGDTTYREFAARYDAYHRSFREDNVVWETLRDWFGNIEHVEFFGGEPMLIDRHWELLHHSVENGHAGKQTIHYNTNGTVFPDQHVDLYRHFKALDLSFSIDGIGAQFEYMRHPAKWDAVKTNIIRWRDRLDALGMPRSSMSACITISAFNIYDLDRTYLGLRELGLNSFLNLLHWPSEMCITNIPDAVKPIIAEKLRRGFGDMACWSGLEGILSFMENTPQDPGLWQGFLTRVARHDAYRAESFEQTFPEYAALVAPYR